MHAAIATYTATALDGIDDPAKLEQHAVAGGLHEPSAVLRHESLGDRAVFAEGASGTDLVQTHEPRVSATSAATIADSLIRHELGALAP